VTERLTEVMNHRLWVRYAVAAGFMGVVAARDGFVLVEYPPASTESWVTFAIGVVVAVTLVAITVRRSPATADLRSRPWWLVLALMALIVIGFGLYEGLGFTRTGSVNLAGENAEVRSFALGAAFGAVALFGLGSHRAARTARQRRLSRADK